MLDRPTSHQRRSSSPLEVADWSTFRAQLHPVLSLMPNVLAAAWPPAIPIIITMSILEQAIDKAFSRRATTLPCVHSIQLKTNSTRQQVPQFHPYLPTYTPGRSRTFRNDLRSRRISNSTRPMPASTASQVPRQTGQTHPILTNSTDHIKTPSERDRRKGLDGQTLWSPAWTTA